MRTELEARPMAGDGVAPQSPVPSPQSSVLRTYRRPLSNTWWLANRRYLLFMIREFTALPIALWLIWLLVQLSRVRPGVDNPFSSSPAYVVFSLVCLVFAVYHSVTWLGISGLILRVPMGERDVPPRFVTAANYGLWVVATIVIGALLIWLGS